MAALIAVTIGIFFVGWGVRHHDKNGKKQLINQTVKWLNLRINRAKIAPQSGGAYEQLRESRFS